MLSFSGLETRRLYRFEKYISETSPYTWDANPSTLALQPSLSGVSHQPLGRNVSAESMQFEFSNVYQQLGRNSTHIYGGLVRITVNDVWLAYRVKDRSFSPWIAIWLLYFGLLYDSLTAFISTTRERCVLGGARSYCHYHADPPGSL